MQFIYKKKYISITKKNMVLELKSKCIILVRDKSFLKLTDQDWDLVHRVHLRGAFKVSA